MGDVARILILEDDEDLRNILAKVLRDEGYDVTAVERGEAAVEKASNETFDLMIADIRMEGMDGLEAIEKAQSLQPDIASLVVSGYASEKDTARAERLQVGGYLTKPFKMRDLLKYVREQLKNTSRQQQTQEDEKLVDQALDWSLTAVAKVFDESRTHQGSLLHASRLAEAVCHQMGLPAQKCLAARWATIILGGTRFSVLELPNFALTANVHFPELTRVLKELSEDSKAEDFAVDVRAVQLALETEFESEGDSRSELEEKFEADLLEAYDAIKDDLAGRQELPVERRLGLEEQKKMRGSLMVLAKTFERAGDTDNAEKAYRSLWSGSELARWRLQGVLGLTRLYALSQKTEDCRKAGLQALKVAKDLGPSALATSGLEATLWLQKVKAPETEKAIGLVSRAAEQVGQSLPLALLALAGEEKLSDPENRVAQALTSPSATNELSSYVLWLIPHLFARAEGGLLPSSDILVRIARDFPLDFLRFFNDNQSGEAKREAVAKSLVEARFLPESVLQSLAGAPEAPVREVAAQIKARSAGDEAVSLVRVYSFGPLELISQGEVMDDKAWKTRKVKFLFTKLASNWGHQFPLSVLIDIFWPKESTRNKPNLYWAMTAMRKVLRTLAPGIKEPFVRRDESLALIPDYPRWHDLEEFEKAAEAAIAASKHQDYETALKQGSLAGRLYRGPYLEGSYYDFAVQKRETLAQVAFDVHCKAAEAALALGQSEQAVEHSGQAVEIAPYRQEAHGLKMRGHIRLHQSAEAIKQFQDIERILKLEFEVEPSTELLELFHRARLGFTDA